MRCFLRGASATDLCGVQEMAEKLRFFDLRAKQYFETDNYEVVVKETPRGRFKIAFAVSPLTGKKCARIIGKA